MLVIKSLTLKNSSNLQIGINSFIKISYGGHRYRTKNKYIIMNSNNYSWIEDITMPIYINQQLKIQILTTHKTSSNPQQILNKLNGTVIIKDFKQNSIETHLKTLQNSIAGHFKIQYLMINQKILLPQDKTKGYVIVSSLLIHINQSIGFKGYCELKIQSNSICTSELSLVVGELLWTQNYSLRYQGNKSHQILNINVYIDNIIKHIANIQIEGTKSLKYKRINLHNLQGEKSGSVFIDMKFKQISKQSPKIQLPAVLPNISRTPSKISTYLNSNSQTNLVNPRQTKISQNIIKQKSYENQNDLQFHLHKVGQTGLSSQKGLKSENSFGKDRSKSYMLKIYPKVQMGN